jgi:c-di-GMP-related signal transduction protein
VELYLARQPVFDRDDRLFAYELLYRSSAENRYDGADESAATLQVLSSFLAFSLGEVAAGKPCLVNLGKQMLTDDWTSVLNPQSFIIEVLESVPRDREVYDACEAIRRRGFRIALDDFARGHLNDPLLPLADIVKVDFRHGSREDLHVLARTLRGRGKLVLAEKVETREERDWALRNGFQYFQGYYFARPCMLARRDVPALKLNILRLLAAVAGSEVDLRQVEEIIRHEAALTRRLLRYVNSAAYPWRTPVVSIRRGLALIGDRDMRRWVSMAALPALALEKPSELVANAIVRARFCEALAEAAGRPDVADESFLAGMFSHLDAFLDLPMEQALSDLPLSDRIRQALLGLAPAGDPVATILQTALDYESADGERWRRAAALVGVPADKAIDCYLEAVKWCTRFLPDAIRDAA